MPRCSQNISSTLRSFCSRIATWTVAPAIKMRKTHYERLLECKNVVPVINENDSVAVEELRFGDNDRLSAEVAVLAEAELLILLTSVDGLMDHAGKRIPMIVDVADAARFVRKEKSRFSVGGMVTKLEAVKLAIAAGIPQ